jgi:hypothetical protein
MSIPVQCPSCLHKSKVAEGLAGRRVRCPECDHPFQAAALERSAPNPPPVHPLAFLDEDADELLDEKPRLALLVSRSVATQPTIPLARRSLPEGSAPVSSAPIYLGLGIGIACALSLSVAFALFLRSV